VIVRDGFGNPADGIDVAFDVTSGGGSVTGSPASSGTDGTATVGSWVLGPTVGANSLIATVPGVPDTISFTATGVTGPAASMALDAGNAQTDTIGATLATPYSVRVSDANGNPVTGVTVTWAVTGGGGSIGTLSTQTATVGTAVPVSPSVLVVDGSGNPAGGVQVTFAVTGGGGSVTGATPTSDASGIAQVGSWALGTAAGANQMSASVTGMTPVVFTATGVAGAATQLQLDAGDNQSAVAGTAVTTPPSVAALDQFGNGVPGASPRWEAGHWGSRRGPTRCRRLQQESRTPSRSPRPPSAARPC
jgi:adhesin/invasin